MKWLKLFLFISLSASAQDTIIKLNKERIATKIIEINERDVKFRKFSNPDGPLYSEFKSEIHYIKFQNGSIDTITTQIQAALSANANTQEVQNSSLVIYKGRRYSDKEIYAMISSWPAGETKSALQLKYASMIDYKHRQYAASGFGYGFGFAFPAVVTIVTLIVADGPTGYDKWAQQFVSGALAGAAIRITGAVFYKINKNKRENEKRQILDLLSQGK